MMMLNTINPTLAKINLATICLIDKSYALLSSSSFSGVCISSVAKNLNEIIYTIMIPIETISTVKTEIFSSRKILSETKPYAINVHINTIRWLFDTAALEKLRAVNSINAAIALRLNISNYKFGIINYKYR